MRAQASQELVIFDRKVTFGVPIALSVLLGVAFVHTAAAQDATPPNPTIRANVRVVLVPVTLTDPHGKFVDGLSVDDFIVGDNGVRQKIRMDTPDTVVAPVSLVVAIQCSGIAQPVLAKISKVGAMIQPLVIGQGGRAAVIAFDDDIRVFQDFTGDGTKLRVAFERVHGRTIYAGRMLDAAEQGITMLETRPENSRRILLILSEERDRGSKAKLQDVIEHAQRAGVLVYPMTYSIQKSVWTARPEDNPTIPSDMNLLQGLVELFRKGKINDTQAFARGTGGEHLSFTTLKGLEDAITRAGEDIHSQYLLSFTPTSREPGYHVITVEVDARPDAKVRTRPGYWAQ